MPDEIHPGSWMGDTAQEFKKLPPIGKAAVAVGVALVVFLGYRAATGGGTSSATTAEASGASGANAGGLQSPFGSVPNASGNGSVPLVPFGNTPILDTLGNLIGWQQPGPATPATPATPTPTPTPTTPGGPIHGLPVTPRPIIQHPTPTASPGRAQPRLTTYTVVHGDNLSSIAARNNVQGGWQTLYKANLGVVGSNPNLIKPGQKLVIPGR